MKYLSIVFTLLIFACQNPDTICKKYDIESIIIENSNFEYNCGKKTIQLIQPTEINFFCEQSKRLNRIFPLTTNYLNGVIGITINSKNRREKFIPLILTVNKGNIFKINGGCYLNDSLANFLINKLEIKNVASVEICK